MYILWPRDVPPWPHPKNSLEDYTKKGVEIFTGAENRKHLEGPIISDALSEVQPALVTN